MWIEKQLKHRVENEGLNLTEFVNSSLEKYFSVSHVEDIKREIDSKKREIIALERKMEDLNAKTNEDSSEERIAENALEDMKRSYVMRRNQMIDKHHDEGWILSPKNSKRCVFIGKKPDEVLEILEVWYDEISKQGRKKKK